MLMTSGTSSDSAAPAPMDPLLGILEKVRARDAASFDLLYRETSGRVFGLALRILRDRSLAEEATLDVFVQVWREADRYDPAKGGVAGWIWTLARTRSIDLRRSRLRRSAREQPLELAAELADGDVDPEGSADATRDAERVRLAVARLPVEQRRAVLAAYFEGLSHSEVAAALGEPLGTIKTRIRAGLQALRKELSGTIEVRA